MLIIFSEYRCFYNLNNSENKFIVCLFPPGLNMRSAHMSIRIYEIIHRWFVYMEIEESHIIITIKRHIKSYNQNENYLLYLVSKLKI